MSLKLEEWRRLKNYSIKEMAEKCDVHFQTYMRWKRHPDKVPIKYAYKIAEILGVPLDSIIFELEEQHE